MEDAKITYNQVKSLELIASAENIAGDHLHGMQPTADSVNNFIDGRCL